MAKGRVLVVEDNDDNRNLVNYLLTQAGFEVLEARDGREGLDAARRETPDAILMDLSLPEIDGWSAAEQLKGNPQTSAIPLIALTAHTLPGDRKHAIEVGYDEYITKPLNARTFAQTFEDALRKPRPAAR
jgi:CheY-like chemotaxis protein